MADEPKRYEELCDEKEEPKARFSNGLCYVYKRPHTMRTWEECEKIVELNKKRSIKTFYFKCEICDSFHLSNKREPTKK
jgi:hypothetical protein